jgi:hypothetical protein
VTWDRKFDHIGARRFDEVLDFWSRRSPVGIEIGQFRLADHIEHLVRDGNLPSDGAQFVGPIESRSLVSELYCGAAKAINLNFHAQNLVVNGAFTNGSIHSFSSLMQFMMAIMSLFGVFMVRHGGKYFLLDVFPWMGNPKDQRELSKRYGNDWWRYGRIIADRKEIIEQKEITALFQRCLRVVSGVGWPEVVVRQLIDCETRWMNRPRNNILYNFTGWTQSQDLVAGVDTDLPLLLRDAARSIFDPDEQIAYGSLPQSLLLGSLFVRTWRAFRESVAMEIAGEPAPEFPDVVDAGLIDAFESALTNELLSAIN